MNLLKPNCVIFIVTGFLFFLILLSEWMSMRIYITERFDDVGTG